MLGEFPVVTLSLVEKSVSALKDKYANKKVFSTCSNGISGKNAQAMSTKVRKNFC